MTLTKKKVEIYSNLTLQDAIRRLQQDTEIGNIFFSGPWTSDLTKTFKGTIRDDHFRIIRLTWYGNSLKPVIEGKLINAKEGLQINLTMKIHDVILGLFIAFSAIWLLFGIPLTIFFEKLNMDNALKPWMVIALWAGATTISILTFNWEIKKAEKELIRIFDGKE